MVKQVTTFFKTALDRSIIFDINRFFSQQDARDMKHIVSPGDVEQKKKDRIVQNALYPSPL
jgi:hypothetical protein